MVLLPDLLTCDFERGLISSIRLKFPTTHIRGCYFHFCQAVYRKVQTLGLSQRYVNDESSRVCIRKLLALAFVPKVNIPQTFDILKANCPEELRAIFDYYEDYWIKTVDLSLWNMHGILRRQITTSKGGICG